MKAFVTGGAGFIGSHIVDRLLNEKYQVIVYDNFSTGNMAFLEHNSANKNLKIISGDLLDYEKLKSSMSDCDVVFHLAANADVRGGIVNTNIDFQQNTLATKNVLESMQFNKIKKIVFSSSATVYGEPKNFPTSESEELIQTSLYGASKLSGEAMIEAYCNYFDMQAFIFRFVSWIGERYTHGVIFDFTKKLSNNTSSLEILGNGKQTKSYLYVQDGVDGIFLALKKAKSRVNIFNLGHVEKMEVTELAEIVINELGLKKVKYDFAGGVSGWKGDSPFVHLDITKIQKLGWSPSVSIEDGIRRTVRYLKNNKVILSYRK